MTYLTKDVVIMNAKADNKESALSYVATALKDKGLVDGNYLEALKLRESQANTYLGSAIAIPHGIPAYKDHIKTTGVVIVHFAYGVDWGEGNVVHLVVGIAAKSDEHLLILQSLTRVLWDDSTEQRIKSAKTADDILAILTGTKHCPDDTDLDKVKLLTAWQALAANTDESLLVAGATRMKELGWVSEGYLTDILKAPIIRLSQTVACVQASLGADELASFCVVGQEKAIVLIALPCKQAHLAQSVDTLIDKLFELDIQDKTAVGRLFQSNADTKIYNSTSDRIEAPITEDTYHIEQVVLVNRHGLHARPATQLAKLAGEFVGDVKVSVDGKHFVSAKSLVRLLSLGASYGQSLTFAVAKTDEGQKWLDRLVDAVNDGLGEEVERIDRQALAEKLELMPDEPSVKLGEPIYAVGASLGIAFAPAFVLSDVEFNYPKTSDNATDEKQALNLAIDKVKAQLNELIFCAKTQEIAQIFTAHLEILSDDELIKAVHVLIDTGLSAPMAWDSEIERLADEQSALSNALLAQRADDLKDVGKRVLGELCKQNTALPVGEYVLVKEELLPSDVVMLGEHVVALVTAVGGASSHSAIIARSLGIPALVGAGYDILTMAHKKEVLVNAQEGYLIVAPDKQMVQDQLAKQQALKHKIAHAKQTASMPAVTTDGHLVHVMANLGDVDKAELAIAEGAQGVGLLRTEFVFMKHNKMPDEITQQSDYARIFDVMDGRPVVARTLDVGGDKLLPYFSMNKEDNPFLGMRGIRLSLQQPTLLSAQLTALVKASKNRPLRIMFPMVGQIDEWRAAKAILDEVLQRYPHEDLQVGIMIEVPSAAIMADMFAKEVDFFSIGTNDLTQYVLAIDRGHPMLSATADGLHPSVLRLIDMTVKAAHAYGKWVGVCGELGADRLATPILVGLGVDELSVSQTQIPLVKAQIRTLNKDACRQLAATALTQSDAVSVRRLVSDNLPLEL